MSVLKITLMTKRGIRRNSSVRITITGAADDFMNASANPLCDPCRNALILTGPTGSGKSRLALDLAERLGAEIVAMDSMTLYRHMDIGTAKPRPAEQQRVPHHLLDALEPWESASVAWWLDRARDCCRDIENRGKRVLFVGGTPLYLKTLLCGLFDGPPASEALRDRLAAEAKEYGCQVLHNRLATVDPVSASRLHVNDVRRVIRALEVWELTGQPISGLQVQWRMPEETVLSREKPRCLCLDLPRPVLYERINARVWRMIQDGLVEEARALRRLDRPLSREAARAVSYEEIFRHLDGELSLEEAVALIQMRSRNLAKRQLTWFRRLPLRRVANENLTFALWGLTM
jgi:tRNA dimethylallyltransferase